MALEMLKSAVGLHVGSVGREVEKEKEKVVRVYCV